MLYIFWSILNLFLAAGFLVICYHGVKLIKIKYGFLVTLIFVVGLLSFVCAPRNDNGPKQRMHTLNFQGGKTSLSFEESLNSWHIPDSTAGKYILRKTDQIAIHNNPLFKIILHITYGVEVTSGRLSPLYACTSVDGIHSGVEWEPSSPLVNTDESGKKLDYEVSGIMKWKLLNMGIYSKPKTFTGSITIVN